MAVRREDQSYIKEVGRAVAGVRHRCGLTQTQLARKIGMSMQTIRGLEIGLPKTVNYLQMKKISKALHGTGQITDPEEHVLRFLMREVRDIRFVYSLESEGGGGGVGLTGDGLDIPGYQHTFVEPTAA